MPATEAIRHEVTFDNIRAASERIRKIAKRTPVMRSRGFDAAAGVTAFFKGDDLKKVDRENALKLVPRLKSA